MTKRLDSNVVPLHNDKYYVYALFKPNDYNPFYVGKGIRGRINDHFKSSNLKINNRKTGVIKKYGNSIRREILCYFDSEQAAYDFEEYLIAYYGLIEEGGCLTNYAKTRFQYSDKFVEDVCKKGQKFRERKYPKDVVFKCLDMFYKHGKTYKDICNELGIGENYIGYIIRGKKCSSEFKEYALANPDLVRNQNDLIAKSKEISASKGGAKRHSIKDEDIVAGFNKVCNLEITVSDLAKELGINECKLGKILSGERRKYLNLNYDLYKALPKGRSVTGNLILNKIKELYNQGMTITEIIKVTGFGRTTVYRAIKKLSNNQDNAA